MGIKSFFHEQIVTPMTELQRIQVVLAFILGILGGLFPVPSLNTPMTWLLCRLASVNRSQAVLATAINFTCKPVQLLLIPVWGRGAASLFGRDVSQFTLEHLHASYGHGVKTLFLACADMFLYGVITWTLVAATAIFLIWSSTIMKHLPNVTSKSRCPCRRRPLAKCG